MIARLLFIVTVGLPIGYGGAGAFNPDDGYLLHSLFLWQVFGIYFYVCALTILPLTLTAVHLELHARCKQRHAVRA